MIHERILKEYQRLEAEIQTIQRKLDELPEGKLICCQSQNQCKWYCSDGHTRQYIPQKNHILAEQLAYKKYLTLQLQDLISEQNAISFYLRHHPSSFGKSTQLLLENPTYQQLIATQFIPLNEELAIWSQEEYEKNMSYPEALIHKSISGNILRSKSESLIDIILFQHRIPFRYECALHLGDTILYPDFTIRHPATGKIIYWEHFGQMDKPIYAKNTYHKLQLYSAYDIIPSINLITTYETRDTPLHLEVIEKIVEHYFT